jgi:hypothetical protein
MIKLADAALFQRCKKCDGDTTLFQNRQPFLAGRQSHCSAQ